MKASAQTAKADSWSQTQRFGVCAAIVVLVWIVFGQTLTHDFVNYDDKTYVYGNSLVSAGLSAHGLAQAFVDTQTSNWHPLTVISHMIDCQIFDLRAGGHHFTNVLLHSIATVLLFNFLLKSTARFWSSAFVAALFAIHPLRVESVAWIAERKDILSGVFFFLTLLAYLRYIDSPTVRRYLSVAILFACGLMSKPMLVTTPVILLLLDYWPLGRWPGAGSKEQGANREARDGKSREQDPRAISTSQRLNRSTSDRWSVVSRLVIEKIPLFALAAASSIVTFVLQERSFGSIEQLPFSWRLQNALVSYVTYLQQIFWPRDLAVFYPHPEDSLVWWEVALAGAFLVAVTWVAFALRRTRPYLLIGWLWYLVMLLPVIGIVEVGLQGHADRYTYLPHVGMYIALIWLIVDLVVWLRVRKEILGIVGAIALVALTACSWKQTTYWRNSETLWTHALAVTKNNDVAFTNFAIWLMDRGQLDDALSYFQRALDVHSRMSGHQHYNLSRALIYDNMGNALVRKGWLEQSITYFQQAIELRPDYPDAHYNFGIVLLQKKDIDGAIAQFRTVLSSAPNDAETNTALGNALLEKGLIREAANHYQIALKSEPDSVGALNNLAWLLSAGPDDSVRNGPTAVELALKLNQISNRNTPGFIRTLAAAYAEAGQFENAVEAAQTASGLAHAQGDHRLASRIEEETNLYRQRLPFRDPSLRNAQ